MNWRNTEFNDDALQSMVTGGGGNRKFNPWTVDEINQQQNNIHDKGSFDTIAYVSHVRQEGNIIYAGCERADKCSKKAWPLVDGKEFLFGIGCEYFNRYV